MSAIPQTMSTKVSRSGQSHSVVMLLRSQVAQAKPAETRTCQHCARPVQICWRCTTPLQGVGCHGESMTPSGYEQVEDTSRQQTGRVGHQMPDGKAIERFRDRAQPSSCSITLTMLSLCFSLPVRLFTRL